MRGIGLERLGGEAEAADGKCGDPKRVGPYRFIGRPGSGGMGTVHAGRDTTELRGAVKPCTESPRRSVLLALEAEVGLQRQAEPGHRLIRGGGPWGHQARAVPAQAHPAVSRDRLS